jgi:hypothetical protein
VTAVYGSGLHTFILTGESILVFARLLQDATFITQKSAITPKRRMWVLANRGHRKPHVEFLAMAPLPFS